MDVAKAWVAKNPFIYTKKTAFMQRLADRVRKDATLYITGQTALKSVPNLTTKLNERWPLNLTKMQASRRRKVGHGTYQWLGWFDEKNNLVHWFVLLNPGKEPDRTETWCDVVEERIKLTGYELVRHTRPGAAAPAYTWRYTREQLGNLRDQLVSAVRGRRDLEAEQLLHSVYRSPGFAGVREQVKKFRQLAIGEWQRNRSHAETIFAIPKTIGYVSRLADKGSSWSELMPSDTSKSVLAKAGKTGLKSPPRSTLKPTLKPTAKTPP